MARPPRIQQPGAWYHVIARGIERRRLFERDRDYEHFLELLGRFAQRYACHISAYVLMPNHFHLFLQTMEPNLSRAVQWLTTAYAAWFNIRYGRSGHLFQGRFKAIIVDPDEWAVHLTRYIHLNPVRVRRLGLDKKARAAARAGMPAVPTEEVARERVGLLRSFRWSSYRVYAGYEQGPKWLQADWVLQRCGPSARERRRWYREYCEGAVHEGVEDSITTKILHQMCLGSREFLDQVFKNSDQFRKIGNRAGFEQIRRAIEQVRGEPWEKLADRHGDWTRDLALYLMREQGHPLRAIAVAAGIKRAHTVGVASRRFERRLQNDKGARKLLARVKNTLNEIDL